MVNQTRCACICGLFHTVVNTRADNTQLNKMAIVEIQPLALLFFTGKQKFIRAASSGNATAATV